jgi:hypothetical protein
MYWADGFDSAPEVVKICVKTWEVLNPDWTLILIDDESVSKYVNLRDIENIGVPIQKRANLLRTRLLKQHGGVWCDSTLVCSAPLDSWLYFVLQTDMFAFSRPGKDRIISNWFLASIKGGNLMNSIERAYTRYLTSPPVYISEKQPPYYNYHYTVEFLYRTNPRFYRGFSKIPKVSASPIHWLQYWLRTIEKSPETPLPDLRGIPMHKLNWRQEFDIEIFISVLCEIDNRFSRSWLTSS